MPCASVPVPGSSGMNERESGAVGSWRPERAAVSRGPSGLFWFMAGLALLIAAGTFAFWFLMLRPAQGAVGGLRDAVAFALREITGQRVAVHANTVTLEKSDIAELNVVQRKTQTVVKLESKAFGSTKTLILRGDFIVKAGFDLTKPFHVRFDEESGEVIAEFPPAKITQVEMKNYDVFFSDDGMLNKLKPSDQELATRQMIDQARIDAERSDIRQEAEEQLKRRLRDLLGPKAREVIVRPPGPRP